ncbi:hypothetical protein [Methylobacter sp.]
MQTSTVITLMAAVLVNVMLAFARPGIADGRMTGINAANTRAKCESAKCRR